MRVMLCFSLKSDTTSFSAIERTLCGVTTALGATSGDVVNADTEAKLTREIAIVEIFMVAKFQDISLVYM